MPVHSLPPEKLRLICPPERLTFETTADLSPNGGIIGQPRGTRAIEFGIGMQGRGYHLYVLGAEGTGRTTAIKLFLIERTREQPIPPDWVYVHNFVTPYQPRAISLPSGQGARFQERMQRLISNLREDLPQAFAIDSYTKTMEAVRSELDAQQSAVLAEMQRKAATQDLALVETASGFALIPLHDGRPLAAERLQQLTLEERQAIDKQRLAMSGELESVLRQIQRLELDARQRMRLIDREVAAAAITHHFEDLRAAYQAEAEVLEYLAEVYADVLSQIEDFTPPLESTDTDEIDLARYSVNVLVDNGQTRGAPVIILTNPTYHELFGRIEYEMRSGVLSTHFTHLKPGALHRANGGYLIINASDLAREPQAWDALKRALKSQEIALQTPQTMDGSPLLARSLSPEPIPLAIKIILVGSPSLYYVIYDRDEDFRALFKVRADFDDVMPRDAKHESDYAQFIATRCREDRLRHFDRTAVAKVIEQASRMAENRRKLTARLSKVADLLREADYWAGRNGRDIVTAADVLQALSERTYRANYLEEQLQEEILDGTLFIATDGSVIGQVNGLSVFDTGDYAFGQPSCITARTFMGDAGVIHIERETEMSGPIHDKGVLTLYGYLGGTYAQHQPLSLTASITFEQTYGGIEGDSASSAELYALFSCLSETPINQGIAVTGSVNQRGEVQPIGGVNEKIEGFFRICRARGLTGNQGVIIPASNQEELMLNEEVVVAVTAGQFHIWPVHNVDEGIELLTGMPAGRRDSAGNFPPGTIHYAVQKRLRQLAEELKSFGERENEEKAKSTQPKKKKAR